MVFFPSFQQKVTNTHTARSARGNFVRWEQLVKGGGVAVADDGRRRERKKKEERKHVEGWFPYTGNNSSCLFRGKAGSGGNGLPRVSSCLRSRTRCVCLSPAKVGGGAHGTILIVWFGGGGGAEASWGRKKKGGEFLFVIILPPFFFFKLYNMHWTARNPDWFFLGFFFFFCGFMILSLWAECVNVSFLGFNFTTMHFNVFIVPPPRPCDGERSIPSCS